eukprot:3814764-Alexandrium_andersonii.AAC.1
MPDLPLDGRLLKQAFARNSPSAPGADSWAPAELQVIPLVACEALSRMLLRIEQGARWPAQLLTSKCVFLSKTATPSMDGLQYRGLMIMSIVYRTYCKVRLRQLDQWIQHTLPAQLFAGVRFRGAQDA